MMKKDEKRIRLKAKIKAKIVGKTNLPRLSVFRSNKFIYAQLIDDSSNKTLVEANDMKIEKGTKTERAKMIGKMIAEKALSKNIKDVVFDRNGFKYTGRIKLVADEARASGLKF
jgi:large subunit ribosomal protein L18